MALNAKSLTLDERTFGEILAEVADDRTLVVVDAYHARRVADACQSRAASPRPKLVVVRGNDREEIDEIRKNHAFDRVVGVGTCTALDMAKAVAAKDQKVVIIPTVLSTACISIDKSVIRENGRSRSVVTAAPDRTIVPVREILRASDALRRRTCASGFGDILARFGAVADVAHRRGTGVREVLGEIPDTVKVLDWIESSFRGYDEDCIRRLAAFSHDASIVTIRNRERDLAELNVGGEHALYYWLFDHFPLYRSTRYTGWIGGLRYRFDSFFGNRKIPTHGEIVAVGTLVALRIDGEARGDLELFGRVRGAFGKLGLPTTKAGLRAINMDYAQLERGIAGIRERPTIFARVPADDPSVLWRTFP